MNSPTAIRGRLSTTVKLLGIFAGGGAAEAGGDGVDEDEVGEVSRRGIFVIDEAEGGLGRVAFGAHIDAAGAEGAEVEPDGRGTGAAVEHEGNGALGFLRGAGAGVGGEEDAGAGFAFLLLEDHGAGDGGVGELLAVNGDAVLGGGDFVHGRGGGERRVFGRCAWFGGGFLLLGGGVG